MNSFKLFLVKLILPIIPETRLFGLKRFLYRFAGADIGKNVRLCSSVSILGNGKLKIGENTWVGHHVKIVCSSKIKIGKNVDIAPNVFIGTGSHHVDITGDRIAGKGKSEEITINNGSWLCAGSIILPNTSIGEMSIIAPGAVVRDAFESYNLLGGIPAKVIKSYK
ncbi:acyltransferase [Aquimarina agarivorans]|uniref:acyltransferase n=1 Tax=Aquimarina agarivorans TaxID=980584 RepID=UPI000248EB63|nr:acyltransferase [Aquimarina agarivorans]